MIFLHFLLVDWFDHWWFEEELFVSLSLLVGRIFFYSYMFNERWILNYYPHFDKIILKNSMAHSIVHRWPFAVHLTKSVPIHFILSFELTFVYVFFLLLLKKRFDVSRRLFRWSSSHLGFSHAWHSENYLCRLVTNLFHIMVEKIRSHRNIIDW